MKTTTNSAVLLSVTADSEWMNAEERAFPVTIDPQINVSGGSSVTTYSWNDGKMYSSYVHTVGTSGSGDGPCNAHRMYMKLAMPSMPRNPRIRKAELKLFQFFSTADCGAYPQFGLYRLENEICTGSCTPISSSDLIDFERVKTEYCEDGCCEDRHVISYTFDITKRLFLQQLFKRQLCQIRRSYLLAEKLRRGLL